MASEDEKRIAFRTLIGIYCYKVMPFGFKNVGATYQRAMMKIFDDMIHKIVECYVDDLVIKVMSYEEHLQYLEVVFNRLREHTLKLNPLKYTFMVSFGKFLEFMVRHRGIEIDPDKIKTIMELPPSKNLKQLRSLQGQLAYIRRFIANLSGKIQPFTRLTKNDIPFKWDSECQQAFEEIKAHLLNPSVLAVPILGKELILYTTALDGYLGALLAQENQEGNQNALYYLSRMMVGAEHGHSPIENYFLALIFAVKKLRHYMLVHKVVLISKVDPLKYLMTQPILMGILAKWSIILTEFDITYMPQKTIKGQALTDFLAAHPIQDNSPLKCDFSDEETLHTEEGNPIWELYFDGASSIRPIAGPRVPTIRVSTGLVFVTPKGGRVRHSLAPTEPCANNEAEYEALIIRLELSLELQIKSVRIFWDSQLIINQIIDEYNVLKPKLLQYHQKAMKLMKKILYVSIEKVMMAVNGEADWPNSLRS
jgi:ribonuclease HI